MPLTESLSDEMLLELTDQMWGPMIGLPLERMPSAMSGAPTITSCIHISGGWNGALLLQLGASLARRAACAMLGLEEGELSDDDTNDAVAELCNILAGGVKAVLPGPSSISLPSVTQGSNYEVSIPGTSLGLEAAFDSEGDQMLIRVLEKDA